MGRRVGKRVLDVERETRFPGRAYRKVWSGNDEGEVLSITTC